MIGLMVVAVASIAVPRLNTSHQADRDKRCRANLQRLENAKRQWLTENPNPLGPPLRSDLDGSYVIGWPECPGGGEYDLNQPGSPVTCSIGRGHTL